MGPLQSLETVSKATIVQVELAHLLQKEGFVPRAICANKALKYQPHVQSLTTSDTKDSQNVSLVRQATIAIKSSNSRVLLASTVKLRTINSLVLLAPILAQLGIKQPPTAIPVNQAMHV